VYIGNVLKCRPPDNRDPGADEAATCSPFLWKQIDAIRPRVICALGAHAARNVLGTEGSIGSLRGRVHRTRGWTVVATYHPAYLLRSPAAKRQAWQDLRLVSSLLEPSA
jgi:DNA polymerase